MNLKNFLLILLHEVVGAAEQLFFKTSVNNFPEGKLRGIKDYLIFLGRVFRSPLIWLGFVMTVAMWLVWLAVLANLDLSIAVPLSSIHYLVIFAAAYFILKERIDKKRLFGALLILIGIILAAVR
jgi:drug/metabolite transporter (DMT)-like permease